MLQITIFQTERTYPLWKYTEVSHFELKKNENQNAGHNQKFFKPTELIPYGSTLK